MAIFSPGQHHGFSVWVVFHSLICLKVFPVEKSLGIFSFLLSYTKVHRPGYIPEEERSLLPYYEVIFEGIKHHAL